MRSVWSRVAQGSITVTMPGALRPARRTADFTWAEGTGSWYSIGTRRSGPLMVSGRRSSERARACAPMRRSGSMMRPIGRPRSEASPVKVVEKAWLPAIAMARRTPVPELPKSMTASGSRQPPTPTPVTRRTPSSDRLMRAPSALMASMVARMSSPSRRPSTTVSPTARAPSIIARCEIDLSPGSLTRPFSGPAAVAVKGVGL